MWRRNYAWGQDFQHDPPHLRSGHPYYWGQKHAVSEEEEKILEEQKIVHALWRIAADSAWYAQDYYRLATIIYSLDVFIQFSCCSWNIFRFLPCFGFQIVAETYALHWYGYLAYYHKA